MTINLITTTIDAGEIIDTVVVNIDETRDLIITMITDDAGNEVTVVKAVVPRQDDYGFAF